jgi:pyrroline-5-carboxylate reductase
MMETLGFIGIGNMGFALMKGFSNSESGKNVKIFGYDAFPEKRAAAEVCGATWLSSETEIAENSKYILLSVKPQSVGEVLDKISGSLTEQSVIISICAGISSEFIRSKTKENLKVVRVMPNTPMMLGLGASAVSADELTNPEELKFARSVIDSCGISEIIPADKMNEIICINGSSPAFIYLFAKCFADYAAEQGIDYEAAMNLFSATLIGAGEMLIRSGMTPDELISQVCSKGGTTVAGYERLLENRLPEAVKSACEACTERAKELGKF